MSRPTNVYSPQSSSFNQLYFPPSAFEDRAPTPLQTDIDYFTRDMNSTDSGSDSLPVINIEELVLQSDVQYDIRRMLISLSEESAYIIGMGAQAPRLITLLKQKLAGTHQLRDVDVTEQLTAMGFKEEKVAEAMRIHEYVWSIFSRRIDCNLTILTEENMAMH